MNEMEIYRISKSRDEIVTLIQKKFEAENVMTIWQKDPVSGNRIFKCEGKFSSLDVYEGIYSITIDEEQKKLFNYSMETYFLLKVQDFVFKTKASITQPKNSTVINFKIPHDVRLKELRLHPRFYINLVEKRFISAKFESKKTDAPKVEVACPIFNISQTGICIIVSKETLSEVKLNDSISIEGLSFFNSLANEMKAIVRNARVYSKKGVRTDELYALGLEFQTTDVV